MVTSTVHWSGRGRNVAQMKPIRTQTRCGRDFARLSTDNSSSDIFYDVRGPQAAKSLHGWVLYAQSTRPRRARLLALVRRIVQVHLIRTIKRWKSVARDLHEAHQRQSRNEQVRNEKFLLPSQDAQVAASRSPIPLRPLVITKQRTLARV
jgi:hypothetical protein